MKTENIWEKIIIETTSSSIKSLVIISLSALGVVLLEVYNPLAEIYSSKVSITIQLLLPLSLLLLLILSISYNYHLYKTLKNKLEFSCGIYWDKYLNPYCPSCKKNLGNYAFYNIGNFESYTSF